MADILFGKVSPAGKLPITFYESLEELPEFEDYSMKGRTYRYLKGKAQYPFGYGLTYSEVEVEDAQIIQTEKGIRVSVILNNIGSMSTDEVIQVYIKCNDSEYAVPNPQLCAFKRVHIQKGETLTAELPIPKIAFTVVDNEGNRIQDRNIFTFYIGLSQPDRRSIELMKKEPIEIEFWKKS